MLLILFLQRVIHRAVTSLELAPPPIECGCFPSLPVRECRPASCIGNGLQAAFLERHLLSLPERRHRLPSSTPEILPSGPRTRTCHNGQSPSGRDRRELAKRLSPGKFSAAATSQSWAAGLHEYSQSAAGQDR